MDAIECGIVKLPRVPVADNLPGQPEPLYRKLWDAIGKKMPKKTKGAKPDPQSLPIPLKTAIDALYGHYEKTYKLWEAEGVGIPPVFIVVCNNTTNSELLRDYMAGYEREDASGVIETVKGKCELFSNFSTDGERFSSTAPRSKRAAMSTSRSETPTPRKSRPSAGSRLSAVVTKTSPMPTSYAR